MGLNVVLESQLPVHSALCSVSSKNASDLVHEVAMRFNTPPSATTSRRPNRRLIPDPKNKRVPWHNFYKQV